MANVSLPQDYGNLSSKAIRKIIPYLEAGHPFAKKDNEGNAVGACDLAGYNHSKAITKEERDNKKLETKLTKWQRNCALRNQKLL